MVADGKRIENVGRCHHFKLQMQEYNLESDLFVVHLGGVDVVLGIQWLHTLGTYSANHQEHFIKFKWLGKKYKLYSFQPPQTQLVTLHHMERLIQKGAPAYIIQCQEMEFLSCEGNESKPPQIQELIQKYHKVFQELPMEFPPNMKVMVVEGKKIKNV